MLEKWAPTSVEIAQGLRVLGSLKKDPWFLAPMWSSL